ncbi:MAG: thermonuclease family protein [bacterium]|nr:thermonuclease family protein [bacterium]
MSTIPFAVLRWRAAVGLLLALLAAPLVAAEYQGKVVAITDGDTLTLLVPDGSSQRQIKVRLGEIDAPESRQPYGTRAKQQLSDLVFSRPARVVVQDTDRYGRTVGRVYVGGFDVNAEMVRRGGAWVYRQYAKDPSLYRLEAEAKAAKRGLWALPASQNIPPWEWRKTESGRRASAGPPPVAGRAVPGSFSCGPKKYCREMASCEEARFYLTRCGLTTIDGNRDGEPCETLCAKARR